ncbi:MAG: GTPase ObgE [Elusimicrobia bacterium]|nr:GTPase ObgE [Elusimicrobiota bacterium]
MSFVDKVRIHCKAGAGGDGCLSFRREKYIEFGGPDGGDGGKGGDIVLLSDRNCNTLLDFTYSPHLIAKSGENGKGSQKTGAGASDMVVRVPVGTVVFKNGAFLADLDKDGEQVLIANGGRGGRGNLSFKTHRNTAPRIAERGEPGEESEVDLELKLIADIGLVGFPNAGKSSLLARLSNARPKVAAYPFTTLTPHLGQVKHKEVAFVMADIPGLIEGAHRGKGLGDEFLKHVERTRLLVHLVDPMGFGAVKPVDGVRTIENEIKSFSHILASKPRVLVVSKTDLPEGPEILKKVKTRYRARKVFGISSATGDGLDKLLDFLVRELARLPKDDPERGAGTRTKKPEREVVRVKRSFEVFREKSGVYRVVGDDVERLATMTNFVQPEAVERLQNIMKRIGVDKFLKRAGIREGDMVRIGSVELEWSE